MSVFHNNALAGASGQTGGAAAGYQIERSLRFNSADTTYLSRTLTATGSSRKFTWSYWIKNCQSSSTHAVWTTGGSSPWGGFYVGGFWFKLNSSDIKLNAYGDPAFRDFSAWQHWVIAVDTEQATATDRFKVYVNGVYYEASGGLPSQNSNIGINTTGYSHYIGGSSASYHIDAYLAEFRFIDGQQLSPTDFGEYDTNNVWQPIEYTGTYGTNGVYLKFDNTSNLGEDSSGNNNDFTANNFSTTAGADNDSLFDSPTNGTQTDTGAGGEVSGNYATFNPLAIDNRGGSAGGQTLNGNLVAKATNTSEVNTPLSIRIPASGKYYLEINCDSTQRDPRIFIYSGFDMDADGYIDALGTNAVAGSLYGFAFDRDTNNLYVYRNNTLINTVTTMDSTRSYAISVYDYDGTGWQYTLNAGQRPFAYSKSGYKALCTANLPDPTIADGSTAMDVVTYSGNGSTQTISGLEFSPDLVWIKSRSYAYSHTVADTVRGVGTLGAYLRLFANATSAETDDGFDVTSISSDGFTLTNGDYANRSGQTYVAWTWDGGSSTVSNTDGSITSSVRANASAGFSIVSYTGDGSASSTVGHGLGVNLGMVIIKNRDDTWDWIVKHKGLSSGKYVRLNATGAEYPGSSAANGGIADLTSSTTFGFIQGASTVDQVNKSGENHIAYCFAPVEGYSAFGSYTGNGSTDGPFVYTGFRPRWVLLKKTSSSTDALWVLYDTARDTYNASEKYLLPNLSNSEGSALYIDVLSNGFKLRQASNQAINYSGATYIYAAFAEHPFKTARAR